MEKLNGTYEEPTKFDTEIQEKPVHKRKMRRRFTNYIEVKGEDSDEEDDPDVEDISINDDDELKIRKFMESDELVLKESGRLGVTDCD